MCFFEKQVLECKIARFLEILVDVVKLRLCPWKCRESALSKEKPQPPVSFFPTLHLHQNLPMGQPIALTIVTNSEFIGKAKRRNKPIGGPGVSKFQYLKTSKQHPFVVGLS